MNIKENCVVKLNYSLSDESGKVIDSSDLNGSLIYIHGVGMLMPGIEKVVDGKDSGFTFSGVIEPEDGYGVYKPENVMPVPKAQFEHLIDNMEEGKLYNFDLGGGSTQLIKVISIDDEFVTIDANHPYAGETLSLNCTVEGVRSATEEEIQNLNSKSSGCGCGGHDSKGGCSSNEKKSGGCCSSGEEKSGSCCSSGGEKKSGCGCSH